MYPRDGAKGASVANQTALLEEAEEQNLGEDAVLGGEVVLAGEAIQEGARNQEEEEVARGRSQAHQWERYCLSLDWARQEAWKAHWKPSCERIELRSY